MERWGIGPRDRGWEMPRRIAPLGSVIFIAIVSESGAAPLGATSNRDECSQTHLVRKRPGSEIAAGQ
jgi:hypothetical protein